MNSKDILLQELKKQLKQQARDELASGKLSSPAGLDEMCNRVIPAFRENPLTGEMLRSLEVEDSELRNILKDALTEAGIELL